MKQKSVLVFDTPDALALGAARMVIETAERAIQDRGKFTVALSGGSTPALMYQHLVKMPSDFSKWIVFVSDERWVPEEDSVSNMGAAVRLFLREAQVPAVNIMHAYVSGLDANSGAVKYEELLHKHAGSPAAGNDVHLDLVLLGVGDDGHTASLFPGKPALKETSRLVVATPHGTLPPPVERITFTFPTINSARKVAILASGENKSTVVASALEGGSSAEAQPVQMVNPLGGSLLWMLDKAAASKMTL